jgi:membrane protease YdiL (CAAX protease family)
MKRVFPIKISVVISSLLFGVFHADLVQGVYGFLMGLLIAGIYEMSGNFLYPLILHITANTAVYVIMSRPAFTGLPQNVHIIITIVMFAIAVTELFLLRRSYKNSGTDQT